VLTVNLYVSATNGNDAWTGHLASPNSTKTDGPLQTLHGARLAVQTVQQKYSTPGKVQLGQVRVKFEAGTYFLPTTEYFTQADSGMNVTKIVYENYKTDEPIISGGTQITGWTKVSQNPNTGVVTWQASVPHVPFENLYYNGVRLLRPRVAVNFSGPITATNGYLGSYLRIAGQVSVPSTDPSYTSDRCPNPDPNNPGNYICNDRFVYNASDPISSMWQNLTPPSPPPTSTCIGNPASTAPVGDVEIVDFEQYDVAKLRVNCVDATNHIVYTTGPTAHSATAQHAGANGFLTGHRYLIENVKDYLGVAGQWFLDQSTWTVTYLADPTDNPNNATVIIPQQPQLIVASHLQNLTFQGLTFAHDNYVILPQGYDGSSPILAALSFQDSSNITFQNNIVKETGGAGVEFISCTTPSAMNPYNCVDFDDNANTTNNVVMDSAFYDLGANGIRIAQEGQSNDTMANIPYKNLVSNNVVEGYGRVFPGSTGIVQGNARNNTYTHNEVYDGYKGAIHLCFCSANATQPPLANDNVISFNLVYDLFQGIMNDGGSIYVGVGSPGSQMTGTGNQMLNNVVHDVTDASILDPPGMGNGYGGDGLYVDDYSGDVDIERNLVYRVSGHAISFSGPRPPGFPPSTVNNNIFAFARLAMVNAYDPYAFMMPVPFMPSPQFFVASNNLFYFDRSDTSSPAFHVQGGCAYAGSLNGVIAPYTGFQLWNNNLYYRTTGTPFEQDMNAFHVQAQGTDVTDCSGEDANAQDWTYYFFNIAAAPSWLSLGEDIGSVVKNPGFKNPAYPNDDYSLPNGSPLKGFKIFQPGQAGRTGAGFNPPAVAPTFVTATYNPATDY
ncbi:MAG TPA: right-handed parallel beta-helix repeat-containing protein, partial [Blastocatellia bacterium]